MKKIILDLCGGTGSWSMPYEENGYEVYNITHPKFDVTARYLEDDILSFAEAGKGMLTISRKDIYGILAAPPCTQFSFARTNAKKPRDLEEGMRIVRACLEIIYYCLYGIEKDTQKLPTIRFWALENPYHAMTKWFLGEPAFVFDPWEFGDAYKKRTALWGWFTKPKKTHDRIGDVLTKEQIKKHKTKSQALPKFDYMKSRDIAPDWFGKLDRKARRAITPRGFAEAFYEANK